MATDKQIAALRACKRSVEDSLDRRSEWGRAATEIRAALEKRVSELEEETGVKLDLETKALQVTFPPRLHAHKAGPPGEEWGPALLISPAPSGLVRFIYFPYHADRRVERPHRVLGSEAPLDASDKLDQYLEVFLEVALKDHWSQDKS